MIVDDHASPERDCKLQLLLFYGLILTEDGFKQRENVILHLISMRRSG